MRQLNYYTKMHQIRNLLSFYTILKQSPATKISARLTVLILEALSSLCYFPVIQQQPHLLNCLCILGAIIMLNAQITNCFVIKPFTLFQQTFKSVNGFPLYLPTYVTIYQTKYFQWPRLARKGHPLATWKTELSLVI